MSTVYTYLPYEFIEPTGEVHDDEVTDFSVTSAPFIDNLVAGVAAAALPSEEVALSALQNAHAANPRRVCFAPFDQSSGKGLIHKPEKSGFKIDSKKQRLTPAAYLGYVLRDCASLEKVWQGLKMDRNNNWLDAEDLMQRIVDLEAEIVAFQKTDGNQSTKQQKKVLRMKAKAAALKEVVKAWRDSILQEIDDEDAGDI
jgi:hypothetical protein